MRGNQGFTLGKGVKPWWECRSLVRDKCNPYTLWEPLTNFFLAYEINCILNYSTVYYPQ